MDCVVRRGWRMPCGCTCMASAITPAHNFNLWCLINTTVVPKPWMRHCGTTTETEGGAGPEDGRDGSHLVGAGRHPRRYILMVGKRWRSHVGYLGSWRWWTRRVRIRACRRRRRNSRVGRWRSIWVRGQRANCSGTTDGGPAARRGSRPCLQGQNTDLPGGRPLDQHRRCWKCG